MTDSRKASIASMTGCVRNLFTMRIDLGGELSVCHLSFRDYSDVQE
jgi:hypothetical protein